MLKVENQRVFNFEGAIKGMRNPLNSWDKCDSVFHFNEQDTVLGPNDLKLAQKLVLAGTDHGKFLRQILVSIDITAPLYLWKELDTYKVATVANSQSTMHKIHSRPLTTEDFSIDNGLDKNIGYITEVINICNLLRERYLETKDKTYWRALIQLLPEAYNQTRTWTANYQTLRNIYFARRNHKLSEWHEFCRKIEQLPYAKELITLE